MPGAEPSALSEEADVVGEAFPQKRGEAKTAFLWHGGKSRNLGLPYPCGANAVVHDRAKDPITIIGELQGNGFLWRNGNLIKLRVAGSWGTQLRAVNTAGQAVGCVNLSTGHSHAIVWKDGRTTDLGTLAPKQDSMATAINSKGIIVGWATTAPDNAMHAVLWDSKSFLDLNEEIGTNSGIILSEAKGINSHGEIICNGSLIDKYSGSSIEGFQQWLAHRDGGHQHAFLLVPR